MKKFVSPLCEVGRKGLAQVGGKGANLGEMIRAGFPVPPGFSIRSEIYECFLHTAGLNRTVEEIFSSIDFGDLEEVEKKTARICHLISSSRIPSNIEIEIQEAYRRLLGDVGAPLVAVRSSVSTRDLSRSSFPGQMDTFLNVRSLEEVLETVRRIWASFWSSRSAGVLHLCGIDPFSVVIAPVVQGMVPSEVAGVMFTANPITGNREEMLMEAAWGFGEVVVYR